MQYTELEAIALPLLIGGLIIFMGFIVWDLAKKSNAGRFGTGVLFFALGLGVAGFMIKTLVVAFMQAS